MVLVVGGARYLTTDDDNYEENPNASPTGGKSTSGSKMGPDRNSSSLSMLPSVVEEDGQNQRQHPHPLMLRSIDDGRQHPHPLMLHSIDDGNQLPAFNILLQELAFGFCSGTQKPLGMLAICVQQFAHSPVCILSLETFVFA